MQNQNKSEKYYSKILQTPRYCDILDKNISKKNEKIRLLLNEIETLKNDIKKDEENKIKNLEIYNTEKQFLFRKYFTNLKIFSGLVKKFMKCFKTIIYDNDYLYIKKNRNQKDYIRIRKDYIKNNSDYFKTLLDSNNYDNQIFYIDEYTDTYFNEDDFNYIFCSNCFGKEFKTNEKITGKISGINIYDLLLSFHNSLKDDINIFHEKLKRIIDFIDYFQITLYFDDEIHDTYLHVVGGFAGITFSNSENIETVKEIIKHIKEIKMMEKLEKNILIYSGYKYFDNKIINKYFNLTNLKIYEVSFISLMKYLEKNRKPLIISFNNSVYNHCQTLRYILLKETFTTKKNILKLNFRLEWKDKICFIKQRKDDIIQINNYILN